MIGVVTTSKMLRNGVKGLTRFLGAVTVSKCCEMGSNAFDRCGYHLNIRITLWKVYRGDSFSDGKAPSSIPANAILKF